MKRITANFFVDAVAFTAFVLLTATGLVERYLLPPGTGHFRALWGMNRHHWGQIHFWIAVTLMAVLGLHVLLHWKWIAAVVCGRRPETSGWRALLGIVGLVGLLGLCVAPFLSVTEPTGTRGRRYQDTQKQRAGERTSLEEPAPHLRENVTNARRPLHTGRTGSHIRGSMTLAEVEKTTGVAVKVVLRELGLPSDVPREERLGRLSRQYGFEMEEVRKIVDNHLTQP